jgi:tRNA (guanine37-N1)-methyltransferase
MKFSREIILKKLLHSGQKPRIILLCPQGEKLTQKLARRLSRFKHLVLICGHYEGIDERVREYLITDEVSIGDYVLTGGELPAMVLVDCLARLLPGVLGKNESLTEESFSNNLLEYPQYTRPREFRNMCVPKILLSGDHKKINDWRRREALKRTRKRRPDLLDK